MMREGDARGDYRSRIIVIGAVFSVLAAVALITFAAFPATAQDDPPREPQVIGGKAVPDGKYPFMVSLQSSRVKSTPSGHFCGGTLLDRDSILTAAHCADIIGRRNTDSTVGFETIRIVVGRTVLSSGQGQVRRISRLSDVKINPRFDRETFEHDAAVIDFDRPVAGIRPVTLPQTNQNALETPGRNLRVSGWGNTIAQDPSDAFTGGDSNFPNRMREARVPVVSDARARTAYAGLGGYTPALMVAAGEGETDTCQGDSGGPLFQRVDGRTLQVGITSFGFGCANEGFPGVYAEVNSPQIRSFIVRAGG